jgi:uncharacterized Zn finger protein (UPF0148 family)
VSSWISESELTTRLGYKILIAGLSEAGKTAVKKIFFMKQHTEDVDKLSATINYERMAVSIRGVPVTVVDLGGQRVFIKRFLSNFSPFVFSTVQVLLFVIDVAEKATRNNSIQYFSNCIERLKKYSPEAQIFVFLHKNDLVINLPNYESIHAQLKEQFQLESNKKVHFLRTTIYRPETVIDGFGRIIEIATPRIARSEYVDGRSIGQIEEYAEKMVTTVDMEIQHCPKCGSELLQEEEGLLCNFCGYQKEIVPISASTTNSADDSSDALVQLQVLMQESMVDETTDGSSPPVSAQSTASKDVSSDALAKLQGLMQDSLVKDYAMVGKKSPSAPVTTSVITDVPDVLKTLVEQSVIKDKAEQVTTPTITSVPSQSSQRPIQQPINPVSESTIAERRDGSVFHVSHLSEFYGIKEEEAREIVDGGYDSTFEKAAKAGVPINLLLNVFFKYIPYLKDKKLNIKNLDTRLMEVFFAYLNKLVREEEFYECLIFVAQRPNVSIEDIVKKYLVKIRKEKETKKLAKPKRLEKLKKDRPKPVLKPADDIITLSKSEMIGVKVEKEDINIRLSFYKGDQKISSNLVSPKISIREVKYLLVFEAELSVKEDFKDFVNRTAPIVHELIRKHSKRKKVEGVKPDKAIKTAPPSIMPVTVIPNEKKAIESEIVVEDLNDFIQLLSNQDFFFKLVEIDQIIQITFFNKDHLDIGLINVPLQISKPLLAESIRVTLPALVTGDDLTVAAKRIYSAIVLLNKSRVKTVTPVTKPVKPDLGDSTTSEKKKTSSLLKDYIRLFDED